MEKERCLALHRHRITLLLINCIDGANHMKQNQSKCNECNCSFVNVSTFNTHMKRQRCLILCGRRITPFGQLY